MLTRSLAIEGMRHGHGMEAPMPLPPVLQEEEGDWDSKYIPGKVLEFANKIGRAHV